MPMLADNLRTLHAGLVVAAIVVAALVLGAELLIPLAMATILSFVLSPIVKKLVRWKLPRSVAVGVVLGGSVVLATALTAVLSAQMLALTADLQTYRANIVDKARWISSFGQGDGTIRRASEAVEALDTAIRKEFTDATAPPAPSTASAASPRAAMPASPPAPASVPTTEATPPAAGPPPSETETGLAVWIEKASGPTTTAFLTLLFTLFLLLQYEDIRDRVIRLAGTDNLSGTTAAMGDAGSRLSKFFLTQVVLNAGLGVVTAIALMIIGVPNPILWGVVSAIMRFVPYVGSFIAAIPPVLLAAGVDPTWTTALATALFFLITEPVMGQLVEPAVLGRSIGLSPFAMVISASFWVLIWGPIGLLLAAPLTLLLVVLGAYIPRLEFVSVLLGDQRALEPHLDLYRRILSGDTPAAIAQLEDEIEEAGVAPALDTSLLPALRHAALDQRRGRIDDVRRAEIAETIDDLVEFLEDGVPTPEAPPGPAQRVLVVPARGPFDELTANVAAAALSKTARIEAQVTAGAAGLSALAHRRADEEADTPDAIVLVTAGGLDWRLLAILAKRAAQSFPQSRIAVLEATEPGPGAPPAGLPEGVSLWRSIAEAASALDFQPSRDDRATAA